MRKIRKTHAPVAYSQWIKEQKELGEKDNLRFNYDSGIGAEAFEALKKKLITEQGYLCAYTGMRILADTKNIIGQVIKKGTFHIEHLKPRTICKKEQKVQGTIISEDLDYRNMVACYPKEEEQNSYSFGAKLKDDWWNEEEFVSPCQEDCEKRFSFNWKGTVSPTLEDDHAARKTIEILGLNKASNSNRNNQTGEYHVHERRHDAIKAVFGFSKNPKIPPLTKKEAEILLRAIDNTDRDGHLKEFCFVIKQLLERHIK
jgi:uncharacterized protein (TIGR02646 family)